MDTQSVSSQPSRRVCPLCGTRASDTAHRCRVCGNRFGDARRAPRGRQPRAANTGQDDPRRSGWARPIVTVGSAELALPIIVVALLGLALAGIGLLSYSFGLFAIGSSPTPLPSHTPPGTFTATPTTTRTPIPTRTPLPPLTYLVQEGDTCISLAIAHDVSVQSILELNGLPQACPLQMDQTILIPQPTHTSQPAASGTPPAQVPH